MTEKGSEGRAGQCSARIIRPIGRNNYQWDYFPCRRPAKFLADGKEWCWQHKPSGAEEIIRRREAASPAQPRYLNAAQVAARYGRTASWCRHCKELRQIARKVGKFLMWREDELDALETAAWKEDRERAQVAEQKRVEAKLRFTLVDETKN